MLRYFQFAVAMSLIVSMTACDNYSKYTIDEKPTIKTDARLLGIWKAIDSSGRGDYIIVQSYSDVFSASIRMQTNMELFNAENYKAVEGKDFDYYITDIDNSKQVSEYRQFTTFKSKVGDAYFLNTDGTYAPYSTGRGFVRREEASQYYFTKIAVNETFDILTLSNVADTTLKYLANSKQVRNRILANINQPAFYNDTTRFYRVSNFHSSLSEAIRIIRKQK